MSEQFKSGFVSMMGRTNVGKSSIMNSLVKEKVAAIANKPQTTRNAIRAIVNRDDLQIIFIDTPGIHKPKSKLGNTMVETAFGVVSDVDVVLFVIDGTSKTIGKGDKIILDKIKQSGKKTILLINKIDLVKKEDVAKLIDLYKDEYNFESIIPVSVVKNINLEVIIEEIKKHLKPGPAYYDIDEYTDQTLRQLVEETIREKALRLLDDEVPHGIYVETEKMKERKTKSGEPIYDVEATIYCLRNSHKGIIIGKEGNMLKRIASYARTDLEKMLDTKINLKVWVKVKEDWLNNDTLVKKFKLQ
ncbi:MAG: GTPase Era [Clostridia bacterium]|nr:GTPase Era [Clostridia bacterium]